jgi:hypothetical protein
MNLDDQQSSCPDEPMENTDRISQMSVWLLKIPHSKDILLEPSLGRKTTLF